MTFVTFLVQPMLLQMHCLVYVRPPLLLRLQGSTTLLSLQPSSPLMNSNRLLPQWILNQYRFQLVPSWFSATYLLAILGLGCRLSSAELLLTLSTRFLILVSVPQSNSSHSALCGHVWRLMCAGGLGVVSHVSGAKSLATRNHRLGYSPLLTLALNTSTWTLWGRYLTARDSHISSRVWTDSPAGLKLVLSLTFQLNPLPPPLFPHG